MSTPSDLKVAASGCGVIIGVVALNVALLALIVWVVCSVVSAVFF